MIAFDYRVVLSLLLILGAAGLGWYYLTVSKSIEGQTAQITNWKKQEMMLQKTVNLQNEVIGLREDVSKRVNIIKELTGDSDMRFSMMQYITKIIPENLWLSRISESFLGNRILFSIEGMSYDKRNISDFLANLEKYEKFDAVALESIRPAPSEIRDAYTFSVRIEIISLQTVVEPELGGAQRGRR
ncbi:PilN domain-containing protein [Candidatus Latescibacterota bacterium]